MHLWYRQNSFLWNVNHYNWLWYWKVPSDISTSWNFNILFIPIKWIRMFSPGKHVDKLVKTCSQPMGISYPLTWLGNHTWCTILKRLSENINYLSNVNFCDIYVGILKLSLHFHIDTTTIIFNDCFSMRTGLPLNSNPLHFPSLCTVMYPHHPRSCSIEHKICQCWNWCRSDLQTLGD